MGKVKYRYHSLGIVREGLKCKKCGCTTNEIRVFVHNVGAYCSECQSYIKFLNPVERIKYIGVANVASHKKF